MLREGQWKRDKQSVIKAAESTVWGGERSQQRRSSERRKEPGSDFHCRPCHLSPLLSLGPFYRSWRGSEKAKVTWLPSPTTPADFHFCLGSQPRPLKQRRRFYKINFQHWMQRMHTTLSHYISIPHGGAPLFNHAPLWSYFRQIIVTFC